MNIDNNGVNLIKGFEGFVNHPYQDSVGVWTLGYGTTVLPSGVPVSSTTPNVTDVQATQILLANLVHYEQAVSSLVISSINQNQFDAITSWIYNLGIQSLRNSTLLKLINNNPYDPNIKLEWVKWCHAGGQISEGLLIRRQKEVNLYFS